MAALNNSGANIFRVLKTDAAARTGSLRLPGHAPLITPAVLVYTRKGNAPNMSPDLVEQLPKGGAVVLDAFHYIGYHIGETHTEMLNKHNGGARGFLSPPSLPLIVTARDSLDYDYPGTSNRDAGTIVNAGKHGHVLMTPSRFNEIIAALRPDVYTALADDVPSTAERKRCAASVKRTEVWLQACLVARQAPSAAATSAMAPSSSTATPAIDSPQATTAPSSNAAAAPSDVRAAEVSAAQAATAGAPEEPVPRGPQSPRDGGPHKGGSGKGSRGKQLGEAEDPELTASLQDTLNRVPILAPIVGGRFPEERQRSAQLAAATPGLSGFALTGLGTGETEQQLSDMVHAAVAELPHDMPRLAQGVSSPAAVLAAVAAGVDLFDTGFATVSTAAGVALTFSVSDPAQEANGDAEARSPSAASVDLKDTRYRLDAGPILEGCLCATCQRHSRAYIHHLINVKELLSLTLLDIHNHHHLFKFFEHIRLAIDEGRFEAFAAQVKDSLRNIGLPDSPLPQVVADAADNFQEPDISMSSLTVSSGP
mmetsp:Transcript_5562/g.15935  ORF Transcript_5562/g.15935 Transcript_5562/m.15935 type:complete len:538 (-) Transcript_5562:1373-2986(-)|eukprot:CAMPEP_0206149080 /NCGR_PEP_ID=MMETSP1473-20131121/37591_1 /ASSEMBLY_ACC=CAM_ASM_001109 /TAXON_ID=1461547 /ORGANISM="Stichococcus sp, Strain RCC1054" /LENGTH=537 /DNA_ID=CAMNT_0053546523 /DNA_START=76 /DNA_END=1689 /DNA_ORIENTATION=+